MNGTARWGWKPWGNGKLLCEITRRDELKGHGNLANGKNRSPTSAFCASIVRKRWEYVLQVSESSVQGKGKEGKAMKSINSRFSVTRVPPIPFYHRRERKQLPFHHPSLCLFTLHTTLEKKPNHSLAVSFGKGEKKGKNRWLTMRKNIVEKSPPVDYFFSRVVKDGARGNIDDALNVSKISCPIFVWSSRKMKARPVLQYTWLNEIKNFWPD